ncbi:hypothetical protein Hanom_Chr02g00151731 [Helianthus anomalus]
MLRIELFEIRRGMICSTVIWLYNRLDKRREFKWWGTQHFVYNLL